MGIGEVRVSALASAAGGHLYDLARHPAGLLRGQEQGSISNVLGSAYPAQDSPGNRLFSGLLIPLPNFMNHRRIYRAGMDRVGPDSPARLDFKASLDVVP